MRVSKEIKQGIVELEKRFGIAENSVSFQLDGDVLIVDGFVETWQQKVDLCHAAAKLPGIKNLVCHIKTPEDVVKPSVDIAPFEKMGVTRKTDVLIIGGGVIGCGVARELSRYNVDILVVDKATDISEGTTKSNNGMIHSGYDTKPTSLKAKYGVKGNAMYTQWSEELDFHFNRTGSFVSGFNEADYEIIKGLYENGVKNGVPGIEILDGDAARAIEPGMNDGVTFALWTPSAGYVEPYEVTLALAENAIDNGAKIQLNTQVYDVIVEDGVAKGVVTDKGIYEAKVVINAAGLYADEIAKMAGDEFYSIHPRRGTIIMFDKENAGKIHTFSGKAPSSYTKGGGPQETPEGTLLWGPSAKEVADKEDLGVDRDDLDFVIEKGLELTKGIDSNSLITYFSGNRAATYSEDFIIEDSKKVDGFIHVAGIQSPGLASAPAISQAVRDLALGQLGGNVEENPNFNPIHKFEKAFRFANAEERAALIEKNPAYGRVICRCETVTEGEILAAIHGKVPATTVDAVKRRTRSGMGRCQAGFCGSRVLEILARELGKDPSEITLKGPGSEILTERTR